MTVSRVVAALPLPKAALDALRARLGEEVEVLDIRRAGNDADLVLCPPCSPQTIVRLRQTFPSAQVLVLELDDAEWGIQSSGPVKRTLDAGAVAYLVAPSLDAVGAIVERAIALPGSGTARAQLPPASVDDVIVTMLDEHQARGGGGSDDVTDPPSP